MRLRLIAAGLVVSAAIAQAAPSPIGRWLTEDRSGVIEIAPCGRQLCGRIVGQSEPRGADGRPSRDINGTPHCGLVILHGARQASEDRWDGIVTNPDDGQDWHCAFWVGADGALRLRGYVLIPLLGQTQTWPAFHGSVAADCTISPAGG